ncbi:response regulator [Sulfurimonas sp.]|uniref:response regulator n=1 Tax=Sulfurimonas sp. TaxID=2022749 RepID=UPI0025D9F0DA|nr:response regulator [Sulfurimonas sp.]MBW6488889.1 response regulator [Sulfurimonas sp.]
MQTIINENLIEIIGFIVILTIVAMFIIIKISKKKEGDKHAAEQKPADIKTEIKYVEEKVKEPRAQEAARDAEKPQAVVQTSRKKRELVPHDKIVKDDFATFKGTRILIAEDNIINQKVIAGLLSTSGIYITIANNGLEALNILENDTDFSVIFMDAHMPVMDGFQATRHIRKNPKYNHIPIVALSGETASDDIRNMLNVGMEAHVEKPLKMDALYDILYVYTNGNESQNGTKEPESGSCEFDTDKGLEICGGDKDFYLEILSDFTSKYCDSAETIKKLINESDSASANMILLDVSGVAANIGADNLCSIALSLKNNISNPTDLEYITTLKNYKRALHTVCEAVKEYVRTK